MGIEIKLPDLGENIESGDVVTLLVAEGDEVAAEQPIVELETDKAVVEVPCPQAGRVAKLHVAQGDTIPVGGLILTLEPAGASSAAAETNSEAPAEAETESQDETAEVTATEPESAPAKVASNRVAATAKSRLPADEDVADDEDASDEDDDRLPGRSGSTAPAGPATRRLARELGIDLDDVEGTGPGGRITRDDVIAAVRRLSSTTGSGTPSAPAAPKNDRAAKPAATGNRPPAARPGVPDKDNFGPVRRERMSKIRTTIAKNMARSASTIPHVTNFDQADITDLNRIRKDSSGDFADSNVKLTMMPFVMKAAAHALRHHSALNASLDMDAGEVVFKDYVNIGVAVDTERGLVVPVMRNVDQMSIPKVAEELEGMAQRARAAQFSLEELRGGTFTISNLGAVGGQFSTPIINHPEVAVLLVGRARQEPVYVDDQLVPRLMMPLSLSYDHRLVDGATAARFLNEVINYLQTPGRLLLAT